ncbi:MAG TPA: hypothetical protein VLB50_06525 [Ignavibacteriaceae bacterium]|nr:hypothetical protein [Ignavibacteriaceae bacterium]
MLVRKLSFFSFFLILIFWQSNVPAQTFGFGCLGFVGGYGGYSYQQFQPGSLNDYVENFNTLYNDSLSSPLQKFGKADGYRLGLNFFRAKIKWFIITAKGFYQNLSEEHNVNAYLTGGESNTTLELEIKNWALGIDLGTQITGALSWKVVDAAVLFNNASFTTTQNMPNAVTIVNQYKSESTSIGYTIGTGFILEVIDEYVSLEGVAAYTQFSIDKMKTDEGKYFVGIQPSSANDKKFIEKGGFNAVVQLNVGLPL